MFFYMCIQQGNRLAVHDQCRLISASVVHCGDSMSHDVRKPVFGVFDQVRHKPGCTATEDGWKLQISDLERRGIVVSV